MTQLRVLIGGERTGIIRKAFRRYGHAAYSCDLVPSKPMSAYHIVGDALLVAEEAIFGPWDLFIGHPDCTYLTNAGLHWNTRRPERKALTQEALRDIERWMRVPIARKCVENPKGKASMLRPFDQSIQPHQFGEDASKETCLWLWNLPRLRPTRLVAPPHRERPAQMGEPNRQRSEQAHAERGARHAARGNISRNCRCHGAAMGLSLSAALGRKRS